MKFDTLFGEYKYGMFSQLRGKWGAPRTNQGLSTESKCMSQTWNNAK